MKRIPFSSLSFSLSLLATMSACANRPVELIGVLAGTVSIAAGPGADSAPWPARGATVVLAGLERATEVDDTGAFSFDSVPLGPVRLVISAPDTRESVKIVDYVLDGGSAPIVVTLVGSAEVTGTVRDEAGEPLGGAHVTVGVGVEGTATLTDTDGRYSLRTTVGTTTLLFAKEGYDPQVSSPLTVAWNQPTTLDMTLPRTLTLSQVDGVVQRVGKTDHAGIFVRIRGTTHSALTDAAGNFSMRDVANGLYTLELTDQPSNGTPFNDVVENVLISGGQLYRFTDRLEALPKLEMLAAQRIGNGDASEVIRLTADLVLLYRNGAYTVVDRQGVVRCSGTHWPGGPASIAPNGAYLYDEGTPTADGAQQGRIVEVATGSSVGAGSLATPIGWPSATELVVLLWRSDEPNVTHLVRVDATNGTQTPLQQIPKGQLVVASSAPVFFLVGDSAIERRSVVDGALLDTQPGHGWCNANVCFVQPSYGANYRAYYADGAIVDTGISYEVSTWSGNPMPAGLLFGQERFYSSEQRQSYPLPPVIKSLLVGGSPAVVRNSPRGTWFWTAVDGLALFHVDATGASEVFSTTAADTPTTISGWAVSIAADESAAAWSAILTNGERITHYANASLGDTTVDCAGCEPFLVSKDGVALVSGFGVLRQLYRFDAAAKTTHSIASWLDARLWSLQPNPSGTRLPIQSLELEMSVVSFTTGIPTIVGHYLSPHRWLDDRTLVVRRSGVQLGYYVVELP